MPECMAIVFAGQGAQQAGMGASLFGQIRDFDLAFEEVSDQTGLNLGRLALHGSRDELAQTTVTQPLMLAFGVGLYRAYLQTSNGRKPTMFGGHSLGEWCACVAADVVSLEHAARLVKKRAALMQDTVPIGAGAMAAMVGGQTEAVEKLCTYIRTEGLGDVFPANYNSPTQTVVSGQAEAVTAACEHARDFGIRRAIKLSVSAPFHCEMLSQAVPLFEEAMRTVDFAVSSESIVYSNVTGEPYPDSVADIKQQLARQIDSPVLFEQQTRAMARNTDVFVELSPKSTLMPLIRQTNETVRVVSCSDLGSLQAANKTISAVQG